MGELYYEGMSKEEAFGLETKIKDNYDYSELSTDRGIGFKIRNKKTGGVVVYSPNSKLTLERRYLEKDDQNKIVETHLDLLSRVAVNIASADKKYDNNANIEELAYEFLDMMINKELVPSTPVLCNAGRSLQQLSACFVLPVEDYLATDDIGEDPEKQGDGIYDALRYAAMIHKSGGGTGFTFSHLRPANDRIVTTFGRSSGPISFMRSFGAATREVNQGGFRRGANMGILNVDHPDILEFIFEKSKCQLKEFNLSVGATYEFMEKVKNGGYIKLISPRGSRTNKREYSVLKKDKIFKIKKFTNEQKEEREEYERRFEEYNPSMMLAEDGVTIINRYTNNPVGIVNETDEVLIDAKLLFDYITEMAWRCGDPGLIFLDRLEEHNPTPLLGKIEATNPCGEQPLLPYEACNLAAVNLNTCVENNSINYQKLEKIVRKGVHFLDNVIDVNKFPFRKVYDIVHRTRKIGLGMMGLGDILFRLKIPYDSKEALDLGEKITRFITETARDESEKLAEKRGVFPAWKGSVFDPDAGYNIPGKTGKRVRNAAVTTIAPNGTTGMIADSSGGVEPVYALGFVKTCMDKTKLKYIDPNFEEQVKKMGLEGLLDEVVKKGCLSKIDGNLDSNLLMIYKTAHEIDPEWHVRMQAAIQKGIDNAVSKTVNLKNSATKDDIKKIYLLAYELGCKGITAFRDGCLGEQVLVSGDISGKIAKNEQLRGRDDKNIKELDGKTYERKTGCGRIYVTVNKDKIGPVEVFCNMNPPGGCGDAQTATQGILLSLGLHAGVDPKTVIKHLKAIRCPTYNEMLGLESCAQAVAFSLEDFLELDKENIRKELQQPDKNERTNLSGENIVDLRCPDCGKFTKHGVGGCRGDTCLNCGWSNCG